MIIGFCSDEVESFEIVYIINNNSDIPKDIRRKLKSLSDLIFEQTFPGKIDKPFIDSDSINSWYNG